MPGIGNILGYTVLKDVVRACITAATVCDLCYIVELGSLCIDHHCASGADGSHHLRGIVLQTDTFTAEVSET